MIGGCRKTFAFVVVESPKIGEAGGEVSESKRTPRGRVTELVVTLSARIRDNTTNLHPQICRH
jgi:hypothetical protein